MNIKHIDHIGIAVKSLEKASAFYTDAMGRAIMGTKGNQWCLNGVVPALGACRFVPEGRW